MTNETNFRNPRRLRRCARSLAFVGSLVLGSATVIQAQPARGLANQPVDARTRAELETAREAVWRAWFAGDSAALERLIPAALAAGSPLEWEDRAATLEGARRAGISGRRLVAIRFDSTTIDLRDDEIPEFSLRSRGKRRALRSHSTVTPALLPVEPEPCGALARNRDRRACPRARRAILAIDSRGRRPTDARNSQRLRSNRCRAAGQPSRHAMSAPRSMARAPKCLQTADASNASSS